MESKNTQPLTIMQLVPQLNVGGVERGAVEFAVYLKKQGHRSIVVSKGGSLVSELNKAGVEHVMLNVADKSLRTFTTIKLLRQKIQDFRVDIVHARSRIPAWLCYLALRKMPQKPVFITTLHGLHSVNPYSSIMARSDRVIAVSKVAQQYLITNFARHLKRTPTIIYRGVDEQFDYGHQVSHEFEQDLRQRFPAVSGSKKVLLPGRLTAVKGFEHVLPWLKWVSEPVKLLVTALPDESNYSKKIMKMLQEAGLSEKVVWLGTVRQMADLYASVDLVLSVNNKPESFGRTVLEALTVGTPVVAFELGGVAEVMHDLFPQGLVKPFDTDQLSAHINMFLQQAPVVPPHHKFKNITMFEKTLSVYRDELGDDL